MTPENVFQQILWLGDDWQVTHTSYQENERRLAIRVVDKPNLWWEEMCPHCERPTVRGFDHAPERRWRHLNVCQIQSEIVCALPRGECVECNRVYTVRPPWEGRSRGLTKEFEALVLALMREMPAKRVGEILGETDQKLWRATFAQVAAAWADADWQTLPGVPLSPRGGA